MITTADMSNATHTPGQWQIETSLDAVRIMSQDGSGTIAHVTLGINGVENANARLIAAAPEMLGLLRQCKDRVLMLVGANSILGVDFSDDVKFAKELEALIAKIEGAK